MTSGFWTDAEVRRALALDGGEDAPVYGSISTDTRTIARGDLYVALRGERFDGHEFVEQAAAAGARGAVVSDPSVAAPEDMILYPVDDTLAALGRLAGHWRSRLAARVIAVVGSNGKTTTKELIGAALRGRYRIHATRGNLNNQVGVPLTLLAAPEDTEVAVVEMGTNSPGEIAILTSIVRPDHVVVTSIGEEHLELLGDLEGVMREELSALEELPEDGKAFVADEPDALPRRAREIVGRSRVRVAGWSSNADLRPDRGDRGIHVLEDGSTLWRWRGIEVRLPIPGRLNVRNALLALGVATELGVYPQEAIRGLVQVRLPRFRGEWVRIGELRVLADCYNANPPSLDAAVELIASLPAHGRRIAVLGTMRELGESSAALHAASAAKVAKLVGDGLDLVVATGEFAPAFEKHSGELGDRLVIREDPVEAYEIVEPGIEPTDTILLKASRGDRLERWLDLLEKRFGGEG